PWSWRWASSPPRAAAAARARKPRRRGRRRRRRRRRAAAPTTTSGGATSTPSFKSAHNCAQLASLGEQVAKSLQATSGDLKGTIDNEDKVLQAMANAVPSEIRGDFQTFEQAFHQYLQAISKLNIKAGSVPSADQIAQLTSAAKAFSTPKLRAAEQHLSAWASKNCGGVAPTTTG